MECYRTNAIVEESCELKLKLMTEDAIWKARKTFWDFEATWVLLCSSSTVMSVAYIRENFEKTPVKDETCFVICRLHF